MTTRVTLYAVDNGRELNRYVRPAPANLDAAHAAWQNIAEFIAENFDCEPDDVDCVDPAEDSATGRDVVTVRGVPVAEYSIAYLAH